MDNRRRRILVIDGDAGVRNVVRRALAEHEVIATAGAVEALTRIAAGKRFDLILCDLALPSISGIELHNRVGSHAPALVPRIVFLTSRAHSLSTEAFLKRADIHHIDKPFVSVAWLHTAVREHLERLRAGSGEPTEGAR
jgi:CheY-like chemotaxis protein